MSDKLLVRLKLDAREIEGMIGAVNGLAMYSKEELEKMLLDNILDDFKRGTTAKGALLTALIGTGIIIRDHFMEIILQVDKNILNEDAALLLESLKGKYRLEGQG